MDWKLLERISKVPNQSLTIVGDNAPTRIPGVSYIPAISDRAELAQVLGRHDRLIFTSPVDYYPLTIAEAITAGVAVCAIKSRASVEFIDSDVVELFETSTDLLQGISMLNTSRPDEVGVQQARNHFNPDRMIDEYVGLYERLS